MKAILLLFFILDDNHTLLYNFSFIISNEYNSTHNRNFFIFFEYKEKWTHLNLSSLQINCMQMWPSIFFLMVTTFNFHIEKLNKLKSVKSTPKEVLRQYSENTFSYNKCVPIMNSCSFLQITVHQFINVIFITNEPVWYLHETKLIFPQYHIWRFSWGFGHNEDTCWCFIPLKWSGYYSIFLLIKFSQRLILYFSWILHSAGEQIYRKLVAGSHWWVLTRMKPVSWSVKCLSRERKLETIFCFLCGSLSTFTVGRIIKSHSFYSIFIAHFQFFNLYGPIRHPDKSNPLKPLRRHEISVAHMILVQTLIFFIGHTGNRCHMSAGICVPVFHPGQQLFLSRWKVGKFTTAIEWAPSATPAIKQSRRHHAGI